MGKKTELIITKGQEFKIVVKDSIRDDDVFIEQFQSMRGKNSEDISVFNSVMNLTEKLLIYDSSEIRCKFDELLR